MNKFDINAGKVAIVLNAIASPILAVVMTFFIGIGYGPSSDAARPRNVLIGILLTATPMLLIYTIVRLQKHKDAISNNKLLAYRTLLVLNYIPLLALTAAVIAFVNSIVRRG